MIELRSVSASNDANPVTGARLRAAHALLRWSAEELETRTKLGSRPPGALRHTIRRDDFAARLSAVKLLATPETCEAWPDASSQLAYVDVDVADRGLGEAAAPRRLLLGLAGKCRAASGSGGALRVSFELPRVASARCCADRSAPLVRRPW